MNQDTAAEKTLYAVCHPDGAVASHDGEQSLVFFT